MSLCKLLDHVVGVLILHHDVQGGGGTVAVHRTHLQGCGSGSGIRIRIGSVFSRVCGSGSVFGIRIQEGKNDPKK
jgi:hypothetical protein